MQVQIYKDQGIETLDEQKTFQNKQLRERKN